MATYSDRWHSAHWVLPRLAGHARSSRSAATVTTAQSPSNVVRVEQDWELVVGTPEPDRVTPQLVCVISPDEERAGRCTPHSS